jgi:hypothetical protein
VRHTSSMRLDSSRLAVVSTTTLGDGPGVRRCMRLSVQVCMRMRAGVHGGGSVTGRVGWGIGNADWPAAVVCAARVCTCSCRTGIA